jgi:pimeloyl-ACP methyl ester carboxylesterase
VPSVTWLLACAIAVPCLVASTSAAAAPGTGDGLASFYQQAVHWTDCRGGFDCTKVTVPLDYADPTGATIQIAVIRLKAATSQGSLLVNPGGPGGSGVALVRMADRVYTPRLLAAYDIVGFDPRGVGASSPVRCVSDRQLDQLLEADWTPDTPAERARLTKLSRALGAGCARRSPAIAAHMSTAEAARDMDVIRAALGTGKANFLGWSYGTLLGAQYAELFPQNVGRSVLDGVAPNSLNLDQMYTGQAIAYEDSLRRFAADCLTHTDCPLKGSVDHAITQIRSFLARLERKPITGWNGRKLNESLATSALYYSLYFPPYSWERLRVALTAGFAGIGEPLLAIQDSYVDRDPVTDHYTSNWMQAQFAVLCSDSPAFGGPAHASTLASQSKASAPVFGATNAWLTLPCWQWAPRPSTPTPITPFHATGSAPILVVSTTHDPATPYQDGVDVAGQLDNATLLTFDGDGHTAYMRGSTCIDNAVDSYLIDGVMPADGVVCKPDA